MPPAKISVPAEDNQVDWKTVAIVGAGAVAVGGAAYLAYRHLAIQSSSSSSNEPPVCRVEPQKDRPKTAVGASPKEPTPEELAMMTPVQQADAWKEYGNKLFRLRELEAARAQYTKAIELCPSDEKQKLAIYYQNRSATYIMENQPQDVVDDCSRAIELKRDYTKAYHRRAQAHRHLSNYRDALFDLTVQCIMERFNNITTLTEADNVLKKAAEAEAKVFMKERGDTSIAMSSVFVESYLRSFNCDPVLLRQRSMSLSSINKDDCKGIDYVLYLLNEHKYEEATTAAAEMVNDTNLTDRDALEILPLYATLCMLSGRTISAETALERFFTLYNNLDESQQKEAQQMYTNALIKKGSLLMQRGEQEIALEQFDKAVKSDMSNADAFFHRGQLLMMLPTQDSMLRANADFTQCTRLTPENKAAHAQKLYVDYKLACMTEQQGNTLNVMKSIQAMEHAVANDLAECAEALALMGQIYAEREDIQAAEDLYQRSLKLDSKNANIYVHLGLLELGARENVKKCREFIAKATEIDPYCSFAWETLGSIEVQVGNLPQAVECFERALKLCRTELETIHTLGMKIAAEAQIAALGFLGVPKDKISQFNPFRNQ